MNDLRFAFRQLLKIPGFTAVVVFKTRVVITGEALVREYFPNDEPLGNRD